MTHAFLFVATSLTILASSVGASGPLSVEQILSPPFPTELVAAPVGGKVAWVLYEEGRRNIYAAEPPDFTPRRLTNYDKDDGQEITNLAWLPDARGLIYVRGGAPNRAGDFPNPASFPQGADRAIWGVGADGGGPFRIADGAGPAVSSDGKRLAYIQRGEVWITSLEQRERPEKVLSVRGGANSLRWSPDGTRLAFVSGRGDTAFVGVLHLERKTLTWMAPGVDRDRDPVWSPDGKRLAFLRLPTPAPDFTFEPRREGTPWSILAGDPETGEAGVIFRAQSGPGSVFHGIDGESQLFWAAGDRIIFPWERTGWTHLYAVPVSGANAVPLTQGDFEIEQAVLGPDRKLVYFSSNQDDIDRRHIWRVPVGGGKPEAITKGQGIEWSPAVLSDDLGIALLRSDALRPARPTLAGPDGRMRDLMPVPKDFPVDRLVQPERVTFRAADGMEIPAQLFLPANARSGRRHPAAIFLHGGSRRQMLLGWHMNQYYHNAYGFNQHLAAKGYVVLSINYRSGTGYGLDFREALGYGATGASEFNDVIGAGLYLATRPDVDPDRIGLWGGSYGGFLTAMGLAKASDRFAAGVDLHGVHDWNIAVKNFIPDYDPLKNPERARIAFESSPMAHLDGWRSPVLLIHGDDDRNVPFGETSRLVERLRERGVEHEVLVFPDEVHGFLLHRNWLAAYRAASEFLDRHLRPKH